MQLPAPLRRLYDIWMAFSKVLGKVMSAIILTILWIVGFGTYGIIQKIIFAFQKKNVPESYWLDAEPASDMQRQF